VANGSAAAQKLNNPLGFVILAILAVAISLLISSKGVVFALLTITAVIGMPMVLASLFNLRFGIMFVLVVAFFILGAKRYLEVYNYELPLGLIMDIFVSVMFLGLVIKQTRERDWKFARGPVSVMIVIWIGYNLLEFANPIAASRMAWFYTIRSMAGVVVVFFIALFVIDKLSMATRIIKVIIGLSLLAALYTLWQEWIGLSDLEQFWIRSDEVLYGLLFQGGKIRKFSFLSGPVILGILMAYVALMCFVLALGPFKVNQKIGLVAAGLIMSLAMIYADTRTAYVILPAGFVFYTLLSMKREAILLSALLIALGITVLALPTMNAYHYRVKTAFSIFSGDKSAQDASFDVRLENQKRIQPFIRSHPIGGGLGSVGAWGQRFSPNTFLAQFPPDSGYVRIAVEQGWIGLILYLSLLFVVMRTGIRNYFQTRDPVIRSYYQACLTLMFALMIANYPQEAITQLPTNFIFFIVMALLVKLKDFDMPAVTDPSKPLIRQ
jgi:putative inorganic carbon (HCO3(-)) transporter